MLSKENTGGIVLDALADHDLAADVNQVKNSVDCVTSSLIGELLFTTTEPRERVERGIFCGTDKFKFDGALCVALGEGDCV
jgi:hypothetical protein